MRYFTLILTLVSLAVSAQEISYDDAITSTYNAGITAYNQKDFVSAKVHFSECIQKDSNCFEAYLGLAHVLYEESNFEATLVTCEKGKKIRPFNAVMYSLMGKSYFHLKNYSQAETSLKHAISLDETIHENNLFLALTLQEEMNYKEALFYFDKALTKSPNDASIWLSRGDLFTDMNLPEKALTDYLQSLKFAQNKVQSCIRLVSTYATLEQYKESKKYIDLGKIKATPDELANLYLLEGNHYRRTGLFSQALTAYDNAFNLNNTNPIILTYQAAVLIDLEEYQKAIRKCNAAIELNPEQMEAYFNRGIALEISRDVSGACSDWQQAFLLGSQEAIPYLNSPTCSE